MEGFKPKSEAKKRAVMLSACRGGEPAFCADKGLIA